MKICEVARSRKSDVVRLYEVFTSTPEAVPVDVLEVPVSIQIEFAHGPGCKRLEVPSDVCYLRFGNTPSHGSAMLEFTTPRGERLIGDFDVEGRLVGIELIGPEKPCQQA